MTMTNTMTMTIIMTVTMTVTITVTMAIMTMTLIPFVCDYLLFVLGIHMNICVKITNLNR